jgi:hypothetical protein
MVLVLSSVISIYNATVVNAAQITARSLTLVGVGTTGGSLPGGVVNHKFTFTIPSTGVPLGSIKFEYCTIATKDACVTPTGMDAAVITGVTDTGSAVTGWSVQAGSTANSVIVKRASATNPAGGNLVIQLNGIKNPTTTNYTFFTRITTYGSLDGTGTAVDTGSVAASTASAIQLSGIMPESLTFCTGGTITVDFPPGHPEGIPNCSTATSGVIEFNQLFSPQTTAVASSQMAASTNAFSGYVITVHGPTLTSSGNTIPAMSPGATDAPIAESIGVSQFGMNLVSNSLTATRAAIGANVTPTATGVNLRGQAASDYTTAGSWKYSDGDTVAASDNGGAGPTNSQLYTVAYIANVAGNQLAGTYSTTLTYICTPTF